MIHGGFEDDFDDEQRSKGEEKFTLDRLEWFKKEFVENWKTLRC
jgi:hypothetical protein